MKSLWIIAGAVVSVFGLRGLALAMVEQVDQIDRAAAVPEPATLILVSSGLVVAGVSAYRRRK